LGRFELFEVATPTPGSPLVGTTTTDSGTAAPAGTAGTPAGTATGTAAGTTAVPTAGSATGTRAETSATGTGTAGT
jgi:hypothetical protein